MGGGLKQRNKLKSRIADGSIKKYYTATKSPEEIQDILEDIGYEGGTKRNKTHLKKSINVERRVPLPESQNCYVWSPTTYSAFKLLISAKFAAALWTTIGDCDETYNYWEPTHYLLYGKGFQTWEYSPVYALRSYTYLLIHGLPAKLYDLIFAPNPLLVFFFIRCFLALLSALTEVFLFRAVKRFVGSNISCIALVTSLFSPGLFISSTAYLPSSFSSYMTALAIGAWIEGLNELAIFAVALSAILSWPFAALTGLLIAFDILFVQRKITLFISWCGISLATILIPLIGIDSYYYGKLVIPPLNIVKYNIFSPKGPDLYGTEPWTFYLLNGFLNFNITFVMALLSPILLAAASCVSDNTARKDKWMITGTSLLWLGVFISQPHKEERFIFPIFPLIPYCSAIGLESVEVLFAKCIEFCASKIRKLRHWLQGFSYGQFVAVLTLIWIIFTSVLGCSRIIALYYGYRAPLDIFFTLHRESVFTKLENDYPDDEFNICYGKEWYRFPTSFFLPNRNWNVKFIQSEFKGQLPGQFPPNDSKGTRKIPTDMNDLNQEEPSRYVPIKECDYLVDSTTTDTVLEPNYSDNRKEWLIISEQEFLNNEKSHQFFRAFYIPFLSSQYTYYDKFVLLEQRNRKLKSRRRRLKKPSARNDFVEDNLDNRL